MVRQGKVPVITTIKGMPLIGAFRLGTDYTYDPAGGIALSTLAVATDVNGVPCGIGPFILRQDGLRCTLAHNYEYMGHVLMGGQPFEIDRPMQTGRTTLKVGILAGPEQLGDVAWPAGTVVGGITAPAEQLRHGVAPDGNPVQLCLSKGAEVVVPGATLHGPILYGFFRASRWVDSRCHPLSTFSYVPPDGDGYAEAGGARFQRGSWSAEKEAWIIR